MLVCLQDLKRSMVEYSDAVFIMTNKLASDPLAEDRTNIMTVLALGQYIEERSLVLRAQLAHPLRRLLTKVTFTPVSHIYHWNRDIFDLLTATFKSVLPDENAVLEQLPGVGYRL